MAGFEGMDDDDDDDAEERGPLFSGGEEVTITWPHSTLTCHKIKYFCAFLCNTKPVS